jgi:anion transporter
MTMIGTKAVQQKDAALAARSTRWGLITGGAALVGVLASPVPSGLTPAGHVSLAILVFAVIVWMTEAVDYAVSSVVVAALIAIMLGRVPAAGQTQPMGTSAAMTLALGGFATPALGLIVAACFLAAGMQVTGLDRRIALLILRAVGPRSRRVILGAIVVGAVLAFIVPNTTARVACIIPIMSGMISAFGVSRTSRFASALMITTAHVASIWNVGVKTASAQNLIAIGFIEKQLGASITWSEWLIAAGPFAVLASIGLYFVMTRMLPPETETLPGGQRAIDQALSELGPVKGSELKLIVLCPVLLALWATEGLLHTIDTSSTTMAAAALVLAPSIGVMDWKTAERKVPWGTIWLFGVGISLGTVLLQTQAAGWLANKVVTAFHLSTMSTLGVLVVMSAFLVVIHLGFASASALAAAMIPIAIGVLLQLNRPGMNTVGLVMLLQFAVSFGFILPVNAPQNMLAYGTGTFAARDFVRTGIVIMGMAYGLFVLLSLTYWRWLGYVT